MPTIDLFGRYLNVVARPAAGGMGQCGRLRRSRHTANRKSAALCWAAAITTVLTFTTKAHGQEPDIEAWARSGEEAFDLMAGGVLCDRPDVEAEAAQRLGELAPMIKSMLLEGVDLVALRADPKHAKVCEYLLGGR